MSKPSNFDSFYFDNGETSWDDVSRRVSGLMPVRQRQMVYEALRDKKILPGTPILRNALTAGTLNMLSCHSMQIGDSIEAIWKAASDCAQVFKSGGGGVGIDFSKLSPRGTKFKYARRVTDGHNADSGHSEGPVSFLPLFEATGRIIGSARSGKKSGTMGTLNGAHPDALEWVGLKASPEGRELYRQFNFSLTIPDGPDSIPAEVWNAAVQTAWRWGDPGMIFLDNANAKNPVLD